MVYHHGATQTPKQPRAIAADTRLCRQTQTVDTRNAVQQTAREAATQMPRAGLVLDERRDRLAAGCCRALPGWPSPGLEHLRRSCCARELIS